MSDQYEKACAREARPVTRPFYRSRALGALLLGGLAVGNADCAQERDPIDRSRPAALDKHFFVGADLGSRADNPQFYLNNFVVDAPASQSLLPVGTYDDVDRIVWEIQEDVLLARKAYQFVADADGPVIQRQPDPQPGTNRNPQPLPDPNADPDRDAEESRLGIVVAAYRIESHFDRRRAYNPSTGEELNVVEENIVDRPWYERESMRVDWSTNLVDNPDWSGLFYGSLFGAISFQPVRYYEQSPRSPNAPNFCEMTAGTVRDSATGLCVPAPNARNHPGGYFDVTSKWLVNPETSDAFGEALPTCLVVNFFTGSDSYDCNPQETTIRTAFRRVEDRDFQPLELTRQPYDLVGGPRATRSGYDQQYGITDRNFHRYQMIHNIWERSHLDPQFTCSGIDANADGVADGSVDANADGTADACESANRPGSQCDPVMGRCTLPYRERTVRPVAYYTNPEMPPEFQDHVEVESGDGALTYRWATADEAARRTATGAGATFVAGATEGIIDTWDIAVRRAVASAREVECRKLGPSAPGGVGGDRDTCHRRFFRGELVAQHLGAFLGDDPRPDPEGAPATPRAVVVCHNPVRADDSTACREVGFRVRLGDIRYNHVSYWPGNSRAPFGGIAHWGFDPLTGEVVSNGGFNMGRSVEFAAGQQRDYIRMILHYLDPSLDDLTVEAYTANAAAQSLVSYIRNPASTIGTGGSRADVELVADRARSADAIHAAAALRQGGGNDALGGAHLERSHRRMLAQQADDTAVNGGVSQTALEFQERAALIRGTGLETDMLDQQWLRAAGVDPSRSLDRNALDRASPLRRMDPEWATAQRARLMSRLEARGFCFQDAGAPPLVGSVDLQGVARWFAQRYRALTPAVRNARILQDLRIEAFKGIALHEVGHSMGLYHLPVSSYDAPNYNPQYWQLRTRNGAASRSCRADNCSQASCDVIRAADRNADNCMGPRYLDPETDEELGVRPLDADNHHAGISYFGNTSTMEYQWERFGETVGLGSYDVYAMGILYGRVVETMESDPARGGQAPASQRRFSLNLRSQLSEKYFANFEDRAFAAPNAPVGEPDAAPLALAHYTEMARQLGVFDPRFCRDATPEERAYYRWRLVDGKICRFGPRDHAALADMETSQVYDANDPEPDNGGAPEEAAPSWRVRAGTSDGGAVVPPEGGPLRWRYRVAWDRGVGYPHIQYFDQGADIYEVSRSIARKYDLTYPAMYFRRGQREWAAWSVSSAVASRMFRLVRGYHWNVARDTAYYRGALNDAAFAVYARSDNALGPTLAAQTEQFDFFARVMLMPEPGPFAVSNEASDPDADRSTPELRAARREIFDANESAPAPRFHVGIIDGRYIADDYDNSQGGSLDYQSYANRVGTYMEKAYAAMMLTDTRPTFSSISRNLYLDGREFQVNFATDIPNALDRLLGGVMSEDWATVAMHAPPPAAPGAEVSPQLLQLYRDVIPARPDGSALLYPNFGYRQQLPTVIFSMLFSSLNTDLTLINKMRIFTEGGAEAVDIRESDRIRFFNPDTGIVYVARRYGPDPGLGALAGGRAVDRGIASRMIQHANALLADTFAVERDASGNPALGPDGLPRLTRDAAGDLLPASASPQRQARRLQAFRDYVGLIDATRNVSRLLGYGMLR
ncbi:MAG: hypothetical protein Q8S73_13500 [Deltaproteobacteria bacterium]|nr:hypothetical protein [Myxococcales bacterium]MDP3215116.1 hypothetical protein [Deltaproteobacteria bacterium]